MVLSSNTVRTLRIWRINHSCMVFFWNKCCWSNNNLHASYDRLVVYNSIPPNNGQGTPWALVTSDARVVSEPNSRNCVEHSDHCHVVFEEDHAYWSYGGLIISGWDSESDSSDLCNMFCILVRCMHTRCGRNRLGNRFRITSRIFIRVDMLT